MAQSDAVLRFFVVLNMPIAPASQILRVVPCPACGGIGVAGAASCKGCGGRATVARQGDFLLYWGRPIDRLHLAQRQIFSIAQNAVVSVFLCFSALGIGGLLWELMVLTRENYPLWLFWQRESMWMLTFWLSALLDCYLVYHFSL